MANLDVEHRDLVDDDLEIGVSFFIQWQFLGINFEFQLHNIYKGLKEH